MMSVFARLLLLSLSLFFYSCERSQAIISNIAEKDANEIVVYLASKGIVAQKVQAAAEGIGGATTAQQYNIVVEDDRAVDAMALLNRAGLPRRMGTNLLTLFAKTGLMSTDKEETIRYQAGLAEELKNTISKIDGVLDADVQISFPTETATTIPGAPQPTITAAVYVKHQGILEDPNSHLEVKIKRLMAGSVNGLEYDNVSVISDRSRFADIKLTPTGEPVTAKTLQETYVTMWGLVMTKHSLSRFRLIFFTFIILILIFSLAIGWLVYKFYPHLRTIKKEAPPETIEPPTS